MCFGGFADLIGSRGLLEANAAGTLAALKTQREKRIDPKSAEHNGLLVKIIVGGTLVEFGSVVEAVHYQSYLRPPAKTINGKPLSGNEINLQ